MVMFNYTDFYRQIDPYEGEYKALYDSFRALALDRMLKVVHSHLDKHYCFLFMGDDGLSFCIHGIQQFVSDPGKPAAAQSSPWDCKWFGFYQGSTNEHSCPPTVELPDNAFKFAPSIRVKTVEAIEKALKKDPNMDLFGPFDDDEPDTEIIQTRYGVYVPAEYAHLVVNRRQTALELWKLVKKIYGDIKHTDCAVFVDWVRYALTVSPQHAWVSNMPVDTVEKDTHEYFVGDNENSIDFWTECTHRISVSEPSETGEDISEGHQFIEGKQVTASCCDSDTPEIHLDFLSEAFLSEAVHLNANVTEHECKLLIPVPEPVVMDTGTELWVARNYIHQRDVTMMDGLTRSAGSFEAKKRFFDDRSSDCLHAKKPRQQIETANLQGRVKEAIAAIPVSVGTPLLTTSSQCSDDWLLNLVVIPSSNSNKATTSSSMKTEASTSSRNTNATTPSAGKTKDSQTRVKTLNRQLLDQITQLVQNTYYKSKNDRNKAESRAKIIGKRLLSKLTTVYGQRFTDLIIAYEFESKDEADEASREGGEVHQYGDRFYSCATLEFNGSDPILRDPKSNKLEQSGRRLVRFAKTNHNYRTFLPPCDRSFVEDAKEKAGKVCKSEPKKAKFLDFLNAYKNLCPYEYAVSEIERRVEQRFFQLLNVLWDVLKMQNEDDDGDEGGGPEQEGGKGGGHGDQQKTKDDDGDDGGGPEQEGGKDGGHGVQQRSKSHHGDGNGGGNRDGQGNRGDEGDKRNSAGASFEMEVSLSAPADDLSSLSTSDFYEEMEESSDGVSEENSCEAAMESTDDLASDIDMIAFIVKTMLLHRDDGVVQDEMCRELSRLTVKDDDNKIAIFKAGGIAAILSAMKAHFDDPKVQISTCLALWRLAENQQAIMHAICQAGGVQAVLEAMKQHEHQPILQGYACTALAALTCVHLGRDILVRSYGLVPIWDAMKNLLNHALVQEAFCEIIKNLATDDDVVGRSPVVGSYGTRSILKAMNTHIGRASLVEQACEALGKLASNAKTRNLICRYGGIKSIVLAIDTHEDHFAVVKAAREALCTLAGCHVNKSISELGGGGDGIDGVHADRPRVLESVCGALWRLMASSIENRSAIVAANGIKVLLSAMKQHPYQAPLQIKACGALRSLAVYDNIKVHIAIVRAGGISTIVTSMSTHRCQPQLQKLACEILAHLAWSHHNEKAFVRTGGVFAIVAAMNGHKEFPTVQESACQAIANLACNKYNTFAIAEAGGIESILNALRDHSNRETLKTVACSAIDNLAFHDGRHFGGCDPSVEKLRCDVLQALDWVNRHTKTTTSSQEGGERTSLASTISDKRHCATREKAFEYLAEEHSDDMGAIVRLDRIKTVVAMKVLS